VDQDEGRLLIDAPNLLSKMRAHFDGLAGPIDFIGAEAVLESLSSLLRGWHHRIESSAKPSVPPMLSVVLCGSEYQISASWREEAFGEATVVGALCTLIVDLVEAYVHSSAGRMCLHCAAAEIEGSLVVFPAASRAGKSTLAAALAAAGQRVFTDDLLVLDAAAGEGMALGVPPRLRLPLPEGLAATFLDFLERHAGLSDNHYRYLDLPGRLQASFGERAPLGAIVLLERDEPGTRASLDPAEAARVMRLLIGQSLAGDGFSSGVLADFHSLIGRLPSLTLRYGDLAEAIELLLHELPGRAGAAGAVSSPIEIKRWRAGNVRPAQGNRLFQQAPEVHAHALNDRLFLTNEADGSVCELDLIGAGIWNLLAEPVSAQEAVQILAELFPEVEAARIEADVGRLLRDLEREGLIRRV